ncbi:hypothetical protein M3629_03710 [Paenibacillus polysaccharolyticus]|uniref:hypothetical protein n=1 Tax=Paenibacillus polysaccharolyticus TaxID=582692 RepID=UPI002040A3C9|nr:hypothetical protein [Paenibacillus polysaccharolyticus]MCM3131874.1 hypothetical protein [Paenibacillus polysaccharolyticus]
MKDDEKRFLIDIYNRCHNGYLKKDGISVKDLVQEEVFYINHKRAYTLLEKWSRKGWYEYGVSVRVGWLQPEGIAKAKELIAQGRESIPKEDTKG